MGIEWNTLKFLLACREAGISFDKTMTLGRQELSIAPAAMAEILAENGLPPVKYDLHGERYADSLFKLLGAGTLVSVDGSSFEGATVVHDMNRPLPKEHSATYDLVFDGGTLEHVFNYPTALRSAMEAVKVGGHLLLHTPTNNYCGHGFYQFSPELFFRALSPQNGYEIVRMVAFEASPGATWYDVTDPEKIRRRVEIAHSKQRVLLLVLAKRIGNAEIFASAPQQSDYTALWDKHDSGVQPKAGRPALSLREFVSGLVRANPAIHRTVSQIYASLRPREHKLGLRSQPNVFRANSSHKLFL